jgi:3-deoxy-D-manno-octulosonic-acid transferase
LRILYICLGYCLAPIAVLGLLWRGLWERGYWHCFGERFGLGAALPPGGIWVHAVSVGEVQAAAVLVRALRARYPELPLALSTTTPTGRARARSLFGDAVVVRYLPFDLPGAVRRFLDRVQPRLAIILETELWPNLYHALSARDVPLLLASARLSPRSVRRYRWLAPLLRATLSQNVVVAAQSEEDAERFRAIGARADRTHVLGNIKFDYEPPVDVVRAGAAVRAGLGAAGRPVWVAGSTHEGEVEAVLAAHAVVRAAAPAALLVLVPRHPARFGAVADLLRRRGVAFVTRSSAAAVADDTEVLLVDTHGELIQFYAAADVAFVGGSLVPIGGHNLLEPAALAKPILTGPHWFNAGAVAQILIGTGAVHVVTDASGLARAVAGYLAEPAARLRAGAAGLAAVSANRGALTRLLGLVEALLAARGAVRAT